MFNRSSAAASAAAERLATRVEALEQRCEALAAALHERDEALKQVQIDQLVVAKRAEEDRMRAEKAVAGLLERFETLRRRVEPVLASSTDAFRRNGV